MICMINEVKSYRLLEWCYMSSFDDSISSYVSVECTEHKWRCCIWSIHEFSLDIVSDQGSSGIRRHPTIRRSIFLYMMSSCWIFCSCNGSPCKVKRIVGEIHVSKYIIWVSMGCTYSQGLFCASSMQSRLTAFDIWIQFQLGLIGSNTVFFPDIDWICQVRGFLSSHYQYP